MNAFATRFDLVRAQSPAVDRRSLSQAWYDALHLANASRDFAGCSGVRPGTVPLSNARISPPGKFCSPTFSSRHPWLQKKLERRSENGAPGARPHSERRAAGLRSRERRAETSTLAREIALKIKHNPSALRFVIDVPRGRVVVHLLRRNGQTQIFAMCAAPMRAEVEKALAHARFALAGSGASVR